MPRQGILASWSSRESLLVMCFHHQAATLRIFRSRNLCALEKGLQSPKGPFGGKRKKKCVITAFKWTPVFVQSTLPYICLLKAECSTRTKLLPFFPLWLLKKDIYTTVHFYSTWKNMLAFHFHADHGTICPLTLDLLAGGWSSGTHRENSLPFIWSLKEHQLWGKKRRVGSIFLWVYFLLPLSCLPLHASLFCSSCPDSMSSSCPEAHGPSARSNSISPPSQYTIYLSLQQ